MEETDKILRATVDRIIVELKKDDLYQECCEGFFQFDDDFARIRYIAQVVHDYEERADVPLPCDVQLKVEKDEQKSLFHRTRGISLLDQGHHEEALKEFNKSICFATKGTGSAAIGYSNRSAVLLEKNLFQKCMDNIRLARETKELPRKLMDKLLRRDDECFILTQLVASGSGDDPAEPKLTLPEHGRVKNVAACLDLIFEEERIWVYTEADLKKGDIVAVEKPFAVLGHDQEMYTRCHYCLKSSALLTSIPCPNCTCAMFCDPTCLQEAHERFHKYECPIADFLRDGCGHIERLGLRMALETLHGFESTEKLLAFCRNPKNFDANYFSINWGSFNTEEHYKSLYSKIPKDFYGLFHVSLLVVLMRDYLLLKYTPLKDVIVSPEEKDMFCDLVLRNITIFIHDPAYLRECDHIKIGASVSGFGCLVRRSRFPNVRPYWDDGYLVYKTLRDIARYSRLLKDHPDPANDKDTYSTLFYQMKLFNFFTKRSTPNKEKCGSAEEKGCASGEDKPSCGCILVKKSHDSGEDREDSDGGEGRPDCDNSEDKTD